MGRPAIVTDVPGCRQAVVNGETGWLCEVKSAESLAACMQDCLALPPESLAAAGRSSTSVWWCGRLWIALKVARRNIWGGAKQSELALGPHL